MIATVHYSKEDIIFLSMFKAEKLDSFKRQFKFWWIAIPIVLFLLSLAFYIINEPYLTFCCFGYSIYHLIYYPIQQKRRFKKEIFELAEKNFRGPPHDSYTFELNEDDVHFHNVNLDCTLSNKEIKEIVEVPDYYIANYNDSNVVLLPKRYFDHSELSLLLNRISSKYNLQILNKIDWKLNFSLR